MRLLPILAAILVSAAIYAFVFERDSVMSLLSDDTGQAARETVEPSGDPEETEATTNAVGVVAVQSVARQIDSAVVVRGQTEAHRQVELRAETTGQIISDPLRKGSFVEEGEILCKLDPGTRQATLAETRARLTEAEARVPEAEAALPEAEARVEEARARLLEAKARLREAEINANAASRLSREGFASQTRVAQTEAEVEGTRAQIVSAEASLKAAMAGLESVAAGLQAARAGVESARAAIASAEREITLLTIKAPFGGVLESDTAELGSLLQPGSLCATVIQLDPIMLVGFIPETEIDRIEMGTAATAEMASGGKVSGKVVFLSRSADETTRTFRLEVEVANPDLALRDGQTAEIVVSSDGVMAHLLPQSALTLSDEGALGVRIVTADKTALFKPVALLRDTINGVWLTGLPDMADVIIIGQEYVTDGVPVEPSFQEIGQ